MTNTTIDPGLKTAPKTERSYRYICFRCVFNGNAFHIGVGHPGPHTQSSVNSAGGGMTRGGSGPPGDRYPVWEGGGGHMARAQDGGHTVHAGVGVTLSAVDDVWPA